MKINILTIQMHGLDQPCFIEKKISSFWQNRRHWLLQDSYLTIFLWNQRRKRPSEFMWPIWLYVLTHLPLVQHICVTESGQHWFRWWLFAYSAPSHYLNPRYNIVNLTLRNRLQWNSTKYKIFIHENAFEIIVCAMMAILSRGSWVNHTSWKIL